MRISDSASGRNSTDMSVRRIDDPRSSPEDETTARRSSAVAIRPKKDKARPPLKINVSAGDAPGYRERRFVLLAEVALALRPRLGSHPGQRVRES
jgi:hypothetical protein